MEIDYILAKIKKGKVLFLRLQYFHGMNDVFSQNSAEVQKLNLRASIHVRTGIPDRYIGSAKNLTD